MLPTSSPSTPPKQPPTVAGKVELAPRPFRTPRPTKNDVLFGRGVPIQSSPGNRKFHRLADEYKHRYHDTDTPGKAAIVGEIIGRVEKDLGGHFLKPQKGNKKDEVLYWYVPSVFEVRKKIMHTIRIRMERGDLPDSDDDDDGSGGEEDTSEKIIADEVHSARESASISKRRSMPAARARDSRASTIPRERKARKRKSEDKSRSRRFSPHSANPSRSEMPPEGMALPYATFPVMPPNGTIVFLHPHWYPTPPMRSAFSPIAMEFPDHMMGPSARMPPDFDSFRPAQRQYVPPTRFPPAPLPFPPPSMSLAEEETILRARLEAIQEARRAVANPMYTIRQFHERGMFFVEPDRYSSVERLVSSGT